jgi:integrase/recombinase XerD
VIPTVFSDLPAWVHRDIVELSGARRESVERFVREMKNQAYSQHTIENYIRAVCTLGFDGKPYEELTSEDLMSWMDIIDANGFSKETINLTRTQVKHFLRWVHGCKSRNDRTPDSLRCIQKQRSSRELPNDILSEAEVKQLINACGTQRDRALVFVAYESGCRASEILNLKIGDVSFDQFSAVLHTKGKTGERRIRLIASAPDLRLWLSMHPNKNTPEAPLWPKLRQRKGQPLRISGFSTLLEKLRMETGICKHVHPHLLRHTRATHLANVLTEAQMREFFGWTKSSRMPEIYVHLSGRDVDITLLKHYGIKVEVPKEDLLEPKACPWCQRVNSPSAKFCQQCNAPLDPASANNAMEKQRRRTELVERFIERILQEAPSVGENVLREMKKELEEVA